MKRGSIALSKLFAGKFNPPTIGELVARQKKKRYSGPQQGILAEESSSKPVYVPPNAVQPRMKSRTERQRMPGHARNSPQHPLRLQISPLLRANFLMPLTVPEPAPAVHADPAQNTLKDDGH